MKRNLGAAYAAKSKMKGPSCSECMLGSKCYAHGGKVEMASDELVDQNMPGSEDSSMEQKDSPQVSESVPLSESIMKDRRRLKMARGGMVNDSDELDAPEEDGRESRGLDLEPVHVMADESHDQSDASLVSQIIMERKKRRGGM